MRQCYSALMKNTRRECFMTWMFYSLSIQEATHQHTWKWSSRIPMVAFPLITAHFSIQFLCVCAQTAESAQWWNPLSVFSWDTSICWFLASAAHQTLFPTICRGVWWKLHSQTCWKGVNFLLVILPFRHKCLPKHVSASALASPCRRGFDKADGHWSYFQSLLFFCLFWWCVLLHTAAILFQFKCNIFCLRYTLLGMEAAQPLAITRPEFPDNLLTQNNQRLNGVRFTGPCIQRSTIITCDGNKS